MPNPEFQHFRDGNVTYDVSDAIARQHIIDAITASSGIHGLRYYDQTLAYYDTTEEDWVEIETGSGGIVELTAAEFAELTEEEKNKNVFYVITDAVDEGIGELTGIFTGTHAQWNALSDDSKAIYSLVFFTDDYEIASQVFTGATGSSNGTTGLVPAPLTTDKDKYLKGDGTWGTAGSNIEVDSVLDSTSTNPVQNKVITNIVPDKGFGDIWSEKSWSGLTSFDGPYIWSDGDDIYYSYGSDQYVLDKSTSTWSTKTWSGLTNFSGSNVWTDGTYIYYSADGGVHWILTKSTSTWTRTPWDLPFGSEHIWTDGNNTYVNGYSLDTGDYLSYVLDKATFTWFERTWNVSIVGSYVWSDGDNTYLSYYNGMNYVLDKSTYTWSEKSWSGLTAFDGRLIWSDGKNTYYSERNGQYVLDKSTSTWNTKTWSGFTDLLGDSIWTDGDNIYYSIGREGTYVQCVLSKGKGFGTSAAKDYTTLVTSESTDLVTSGAVYTSLAAKADSSQIQTLTNQAQNKVLYFTGVACAATTGNFTSYSNAAITANHVVSECVFANPSAITTDVTWTTANGSVTLNGTCTTATTVNLVLVKKDN